MLVKVKLTSCLLYVQHALRLSAFGQLHKVLGMDPLPSKMPKKPRSETPIDYTGKPGELTCEIQAIRDHHGRNCWLFIYFRFILYRCNAIRRFVSSCGKISCVSVMQCKSHPVRRTLHQWKGQLRKKREQMTRVQIKRRKSCRRNVSNTSRLCICWIWWQHRLSTIPISRSTQ